MDADRGLADDGGRQRTGRVGIGVNDRDEMALIVVFEGSYTAGKIGLVLHEPSPGVIGERGRAADGIDDLRDVKNLVAVSPAAPEMEKAQRNTSMAWGQIAPY